MTAEDREAQLTAYALDDPGLSPAERQEIESLLACDPTASRAVEETRHLARILTDVLAAEQDVGRISNPSCVDWVVGRIANPSYDGLAAEQAAMPAEAAVTVPAAKPVPAKQRRWAKQLVAAAAVLIAVGGTYLTSSKLTPERDREAQERHAAMAAESRHGTMLTSRGSGGARVYSEVDSDARLSLQSPLFEGHSLLLPATEAPPVGLPDLPDQRISGILPSPNDRHPQLIENAFTRVEGVNALSTFGVDVDTASYAIVRKYLSMGQLPPANAVRLEEMVNYFPYADKPPEGNDPFAVTVEMADCPWQPAHRLVRLGLKAKPIANDKRPPSNLVFLIDVSGSMFSPERLPLVKSALKLLVSQLGENDRVAMVAYAGNTGLVLDSTSAIHKDKIVEALDRLEAGGSTNGSGGIQQAYDVAVANFIKNGTNRVILCTDGDWNVGTTSTEALMKLIEKKRESGVFLSVCGFGFGNLRDEMMVKLADTGNGNYAYIDTLKEAHKTFVEQLGGTLVTVAKDVKIQVEFNPAVVKSYRLLGYEKRALAAKDFHDDTKDAGEMGAGHVVTALYELVPVGAPEPGLGKDGLRYQKDPAPKAALKADEAFHLKLRHKPPAGDTSTLRELPVKDKTVEYAKASEDFQFAAAVASFAMLLRDSPHKGHSNYGLVLELAEAARKHDPGEYRAEFVELVKKAKGLAGKP